MLFILISLPEHFIAILANSLMLTISSEPMLTGPANSSCLINLKIASIHSSMYKKDLVCSPSPHTSISVSASAALRHIAAGAFSLPSFQVPCGPNILWNLATLTSNL